jgi:signal transduction histidine kinase/ligand-binding sensor domain-containing protein
MKILLGTALLIANLCFATIATAQTEAYPIRIYTKETGFDYGFKKTVRDKNNFTWLMFDNSIQRFDGEYINAYFQGVESHSLISDAQGTIWVSNEEGMFFFDSLTNDFVEIEIEEDTSSRKVLLAATRRDNGQKTAAHYYVSPNGLYKYNEEKKSFVFQKELFQNTKLPRRIIDERLSIFEDVIFHTTIDTVWRRPLGTEKKDFQLFSQIRNLIALDKNRVIVSTWETKSWVYDFSSGKKMRLFLPDGDPPIFIFDAIPAKKGFYYLATLKGLFMFDIHTGLMEPVRLVLQGEVFPQQRFNTLYRAPDETIWTATENSLLYFSDSDNNIHFHKGGEGSFASDVRNFLEDEKGNLWLATVNGVTYWNFKDNTFTTLYATEGADHRLNHPSIRGLAQDGDNLIIGQTNKGIWIYNPGTKEFKRPVFEDTEAGKKLQQKSERDFINQIITLRNGNHIVAARDGAYIIEKESYKVRELDFPGAGFNLRFSYEDSKGNLFIGTRNGLFCLDASHNIKYSIIEELDSPHTLSIMEHDGGYYLGTTKGVYFFTEKNGTPHVEKVIPELFNQWISSIFKDNNNQIWLVSKGELHRYRPKEKTLTTYGYAENVRGDYFNENSFIQTRSGKVYIGGTHGINYFFPEKINPENPVLKPIIESVRIPLQDSLIKTVNKPINMKYSFRNIEIDFTTAFYGTSKNLRYRYRLVKDGSWHNLDHQNRLTLWRLPPGKYQFEVAASSSKDEWHSSKDILNFTIAPPFWRTWWFVMVVISLIGFILLILIKSFKEKLKIEKIANTFATSLYGQNTVDGILWDIAQNCVRKLGFVDCVVYLIDEKRGVLIQKAAFGPKNPYGKEITNLLEIPFGKGIVGAVALNQKPELVKNTKIDPRYLLDYQQAQSEIAVPIFVDGKVFAIIDSEHPKQNYYKRFHLKILLKIATICSERITKYLSEENLRAKIARDLHDEMGSTLTSINITSKIAEQDLIDNDQVKKQLKKINLHTSSMMEKMSDMVWVINPANDNFNKVILRIKEYAVEILEPANIDLSFSGMKNAEYVKLNPEQRKNVYMIAKEALNNAVKYSGATQIKLIFESTSEHRFKMTISDNGKGYEPTQIKPGNGIKNMSFRAEEILAELIVKTAVGQGTTVSLVLPQKVAPDYRDNLHI